MFIVISEGLSADGLGLANQMPLDLIGVCITQVW